MKSIHHFLGSLLCCLIMFASAHAGENILRYTGVNLAGAEFAESVLPGTPGTDYAYPGAAQVNYYVGKGLNCFRLPFRWERLQRTLGGAFDAGEQARLTAAVTLILNAGATVILDPHNYARYRQSGSELLIGGGTLTSAHLADFWSKLATLYANHPRVIFGLMNEPHTMPTETWRDAANAAIVAIRGTGAKNLILVPGNAWTGAHSWSQNWYGTANATAMLAIVDSENNYAFEVHQYVDSDYSGTNTTVLKNDDINTGATALAGFTTWLRANGKRGFLGEFATPVYNSSGAVHPLGNQALEKMLAHLDANNDVWLGWTWWAGGPMWGNYGFSSEPLPSGADRPQMATLVAHKAPTLPQSLLVTRSTLAVNEGSTATFAVALASKPIAPVVVTVSRVAGGDADLSVSSGATLTFTVANWSLVQTVTIAAAADADTLNGTAIMRVSSLGFSSVDVATSEVDSAGGPVNRPPTISSIANQTIAEDTASAALAFSMSDADGDVLTVTASSSNTVLIPGSGLVIAGTGNSRTLTITPAADRNGSATITLTVNDGTTTTTSTFTVTVTPVNDVPVCTAIPTFSGTLVVGSLQTASTGTWNDSKDAGTIASYAYQWQRADDGAGTNTTSIVGATAQTYTLTAAEVGKFIRVRVTATDAGTPLPALSVSAESAWSSSAVAASSSSAVATLLSELSGPAPSGATVTVNGATAAMLAGRWKATVALPSGTTLVEVRFIASDGSMRSRMFSLQR